MDPLQTVPLRIKRKPLPARSPALSTCMGHSSHHGFNNSDFQQGTAQLGIENLPPDHRFRGSESHSTAANSTIIRYHELQPNNESATGTAQAGSFSDSNQATTHSIQEPDNPAFSHQRPYDRIQSHSQSGVSPEREASKNCNPSLPSSLHHYHVFQYWKWEIVELLFAACLVTAIFALLAAFNGQNVPDWGYAINLSTLLALLATIFRATVVTILGQIISQAKWSWYSGRRARPFQQFQEFDAASRGMLGAITLIPKVLKDDILSATAAIIIVASLAVGSFVQQAIKTKACPHPLQGTVASIPYAHYVPRQAINYEEGQVLLFSPSDQQLELAIYTSLTTPNGTENQINPVCATGNCTFPGGDPINDNGTQNSANSSGTFSTVGLCRSCIDTTSLLNYSSIADEDAIFYSLPNGLSISYQAYGTFLEASTDSSFTWSGDLISPDFGRAARWALANVTILTFSTAGCGQGPVTPECGFTADGLTATPLDNQTARAMAVSCALYSCTRTYYPSVTNNDLLEPQIDTNMMWPVITGVPGQECRRESGNAETNEFCNFAAVQSPCLANGTMYTAQNVSSLANSTKLQFYEETQDGNSYTRNVSAPEQCIYRLNAGFGMVVSNLFQSTIFTKGQCSSDPRNGDVTCLGSGGSDSVGLTSWLNNVYNNANATLETIESYFESFSISVTNQYRMTFGSSIFNDSGLFSGINTGLLPQGEVQGIVWQSSVCTSMEWEWLLLPASIWLITSILLVWTIARSWELRHVRPVWKDNVLPAILYRERFGGDDGSILSKTCADSMPIQVDETTHAGNGELMEIKEVKDLASRTRVRFEWAEHVGEKSLEAASSNNVERFELKGLIKRHGWPANVEAAASESGSNLLLPDS